MCLWCQYLVPLRNLPSEVLLEKVPGIPLGILLWIPSRFQTSLSPLEDFFLKNIIDITCRSSSRIFFTSVSRNAYKSFSGFSSGVSVSILQAVFLFFNISNANSKIFFPKVLPSSTHVLHKFMLILNYQIPSYKSYINLCGSYVVLWSTGSSSGHFFPEIRLFLFFFFAEKYFEKFNTFFFSKSVPISFLRHFFRSSHEVSARSLFFFQNQRFLRKCVQELLWDFFSFKSSRIYSALLLEETVRFIWKFYLGFTKSGTTF